MALSEASMEAASLKNLLRCFAKELSAASRFLVLQISDMKSEALGPSAPVVSMEKGIKPFTIEG
jgi:hypothetical protein